MKKRLISLVAVLILCVLCVSGAAAAEPGPLGLLAGQIRDLMLDTPNITVTGTAEFLLDGLLFKTAKGTLLQDFTASYQEIMLEGPDCAGQNHVNGYAVSNFDYDVRVLERRHGKEFLRTSAHEIKDSIIRPTLFSTQVVNLACLAAESLDGDPRVVTADAENGGTRVTVTLKDEEMPALVQTAANLVWQLSAKLYCALDITTFTPREYSRLEYFDTYAEGILYTTKSIQIRDLTLCFDSDANGYLRAMSGELSLILNSPSAGPRILTIRPALEIGIPGETSIWSSPLVPDQLRPTEEAEDSHNP